MRIIGGKWRGHRLASVGRGDPARHLRPTTDRVRESIFNLLTGGRLGDPLPGANVLDVFAGTGALGLEALSRGAQHVTFIENGRAALSILRENIARLGADDATTVIARDATRLPANTAAPATLVFLDPPYGKGLGERALSALQRGGWLAPGAVIVWEEATPKEPPQGFSLLDRRRYGDSTVTLLSYAGAST